VDLKQIQDCGIARSRIEKEREVYDRSKNWDKYRAIQCCGLRPVYAQGSGTRSRFGSAILEWNPFQFQNHRCKSGLDWDRAGYKSSFIPFISLAAAPLEESSLDTIVSGPLGKPRDLA
jgi:hypothetical protein